MRRTLVTLATVAVAGIAASSAHAAAPVAHAATVGPAQQQQQQVAPAPPPAAPKLWATVNICDTPSFPNIVGIRASLPGDGTGKRMYARFRLQYFSHLRGGWFPVDGGVSPRMYAGSARREYRQVGYSFHVNPPSSGQFTLRGVVDMEWRKKKHRRVRKVRLHRHGKVVTVRRRVGRASWKTSKRRVQVTRGPIPGFRGQSLASCALS